jgi:hypothetical protein
MDGGGLTSEAGNGAPVGPFQCGSLLHGWCGAGNSPRHSSGGGGGQTTVLDGGVAAPRFNVVEERPPKVIRPQLSFLQWRRSSGKLLRWSAWRDKAGDGLALAVRL